LNNFNYFFVDASSPLQSPTSTINPLKCEDTKSKTNQKSNPISNTFVFNFVGTEKEVNHIENDGLDMTNRSNRKTNVRFKINI